MSEHYVIISADGHCGLPVAEYRPYLETRYHRAFDEWEETKRAERAAKLDTNFDYIMGWETSNEEGLRGAYDPVVRDRELDSDGVSADVLFADADAITGMGSPPFDAGLGAGGIVDPDLAFAGAHAHNRFLAEMCSTTPERRAGIALVPLCHDPTRAVAEAEWADAQPGIRGVMVPTMWRDREPYSSEVYEPFWAVCAAAHLPVHTHSGEAPHEEYNGHLGIYLAEVVWWAARPSWHLLFSGVFERHADLMFVVTEAAAYWIADSKWKWDQYMGGGHTTKKMAALLAGKISKLPSEYFGTNLFAGASTMSKEEIRRRHVLGMDAVMWGTDYPHPEGSWPNTAAKLKADFCDVPVSETRQLLGGTAARVYGFDLDLLQPVADRVGPTPEDLGQDPELHSDPGAAESAKWWLAEYGITPTRPAEGI
ncbi:MAG TPA: amidohydrolase family protein [Acidimicrobiales bacterium]|nr:amidohydrolase family protein [Acidimicrobiales bacterium]